ncbi:hypothetical protein BC628DRAFT_483842 [Trametes gibbosa]|nr:hypothetical protein BC628DRAFT_483842 [Trametes gibbosa]
MLVAVKVQARVKYRARPACPPPSIFSPHGLCLLLTPAHDVRPPPTQSRRKRLSDGHAVPNVGPVRKPRRAGGAHPRQTSGPRRRAARRAASQRAARGLAARACRSHGCAQRASGRPAGGSAGAAEAEGEAGRGRALKLQVRIPDLRPRRLCDP